MKIQRKKYFSTFLPSEKTGKNRRRIQIIIIIMFINCLQ
jgi:hypothetical protein